MGLCVLYYVEYSLYNVKKVGFFYLGCNYTLSLMKMADTFPGFCPGRALAPFEQKNSRGRKKTQIDGPEGAPNFSDGKATKSDFRNVVLAF